MSRLNNKILSVIPNVINLSKYNLSQIYSLKDILRSKILKCGFLQYWIDIHVDQVRSFNNTKSNNFQQILTKFPVPFAHSQQEMKREKSLH